MEHHITMPPPDTGCDHHAVAFTLTQKPRKRRLEVSTHEAFLLSTDDDSVSSEKPGKKQLTSVQLKQTGLDLALKSDFVKALVSFDSALRLLDWGEDASQASALLELRSQCLLALDRDYEAIEASKQATELTPDWAPAWQSLGRAQLNFGEPRLAKESFTRLLSLDPSSEEAQEDLGEAQRMLAQVEGAGVDGRVSAKAFKGSASTRLRCDDDAANESAYRNSGKVTFGDLP